jgi:acyl-CoA reductase-like NAD-dependent aldehyde dehydrogenase
VKPTIFADVHPDMKIVREEIFGPVGVVIKFKTEEEVIEKANATDYGLASYLYTTNLNRAIRISNAIEAGCCFVSVSFSWLARPRLTHAEGQLYESALPTGTIRWVQAVGTG